MATSSNVSPKNYSLSDIKASLMQPALTSSFHVRITPPPQEGALKFIKEVVKNSSIDDLLMLSCSEASLPGSSLATHDLNNDVMGITQKHAYRRLYDDRADFTFYVTVDQKSQYDQIRYFERWIQYIAGEQIDTSDDPYVPHRVAYPDDYKTTMYITKFERVSGGRKGGVGSKNAVSSEKIASGSLSYTFFNAFPISINSIPVSYDSSQLLKCTVSFSYDKYIMGKVTPGSGTEFSNPQQTPATGVPNVGDTSSYWNSNAFSSGIDFGTAANLNLNLSGVNALNSNIAPSQNKREPNPGGIPSTGTPDNPTANVA